MFIDREINFNIKSSFENIQLISVSIRAILSFLEFDELFCYDVELAITEVLNNCVEHSYKLESNHDIKIQFILKEKNLIIKVFDDGLEIPKDIFDNINDYEFDPLTEGGRGLFLVNQIMDSISYSKLDNLNCFIMEKNL